MSDQTTHKSELNRLAALTERAELGGGAKAIEKRHAQGKLTARERLNLLFDPHTFVEMNQLAESQAVDFGMQEKKVPGDGVVIGYGAIDKRLVFAYAQDATVLGGSVGTVHGRKICRIMDEALKVKAPIVGLFDSGGGRIHEGFFASRGVAGMFYRNTAASGVIPQISAMMGPCAGVSVYSPALTDFIIMVEGTSQMAITGPGVIKSVTGEDVTMEELGGAKIHSEITGQAHIVVKTDKDCIQSIRNLLAYLPSNNEGSPPIVESGDDPFRMDSSLEKIVPADFRKAYDMRKVITRVVDHGTFQAATLWASANVLIFLPFSGLFARLATRLISDRPADEKVIVQPKFLDVSLVELPSMALERARLEVGHMAELVEEMLEQLKAAFESGDFTDLFKRHDQIVVLREEILRYLQQVGRHELTEPEAVEHGRLVAATSDIEAMSSALSHEMEPLSTSMREAEIEHSETTATLLGQLKEVTRDQAGSALRAIVEKDERAAQDVLVRRVKIMKLVSDMLALQAERLARDDPKRLIKHRIQVDMLEKIRRVCSTAEHMAISVLPRGALAGEA